MNLEEINEQDWGFTLKTRVEAAVQKMRGLLDTAEARHRIYEVKWRPSQQAYLDSMNDPGIFLSLMVAPNQGGKSFVHCADIIADCLGYEPWSGRPRPVTPYDIALMLPDYDNHARKFLKQNVLQLLPEHCVKVERTQKGAPRVIQVTDPVTGHVGKPITIFTHGQDFMLQEGGTWQRFAIDEPCPRTNFISIARGLQKTDGKISMTMTLLTELWIWDQLYMKAANNGGPEKEFFAITARPEENVESSGGHLPDRGVKRFRSLLTPQEEEVRVFGRPHGLVGLVYKEYDERMHVVPATTYDQIMEPYTDPETGLVELPHFLIVDPHDRLPWAMIWVFYIPEFDTFYQYDEFPKEDFWSFHSHSYNYDTYAEEIYRRQYATHRIMDPNYGEAPAGSTGLTHNQQIARRSRPGYPLGFNTTINDNVEVGHQAVHERLHFNPHDIDSRPRLFVHERCRNTRHSATHYTWDEFRGVIAEGKERKAKPKEKFKHYMDLWRYLCMFPATRRIDGGRAQEAYSKARIYPSWKTRRGRPAPHHQPQYKARFPRSGSRAFIRKMGGG
jgi:hypothetical protein